jgi:hypothetical protein
MVRKPGFKPKITRVKLNPEQAVLACSCFHDGWQVYLHEYVTGGGGPWHACCQTGARIGQDAQESWSCTAGGSSWRADPGAVSS